MKHRYTKIVSIALSTSIVVLMGLVTPRTADSKIITNVPPDISGDELMAVVIEDFENSTVGDKGWVIKSTPRKFEKAGTDNKKSKMKNPVPKLGIKVINGAPNDLSVEKWSLTGEGMKKEKLIGVNFKFRYPGVNSVHILPPLEVHWKRKTPVYTYNPSTRQDEQERGIELPGKAKAISIWVHGRGNPYNLELWLKDYRGNTHILKFGSVNFVGWRPMKVNVPNNVPQEYASYPQTRMTKITRFVLRAQTGATREELIENTFFFFDQLKVLTDTYEVNFDGENLDKAFEGKSTGNKKGNQ